eukprot:6205605-Pleurochrysis_carterae.AAC.4
MQMTLRRLHITRHAQSRKSAQRDKARAHGVCRHVPRGCARAPPSPQVAPGPQQQTSCTAPRLRIARQEGGDAVRARVCNYALGSQNADKNGAEERGWGGSIPARTAYEEQLRAVWKPEEVRRGAAVNLQYTLTLGL